MQRVVLNLQQPAGGLPQLRAGIKTVPRGAGSGGNYLRRKTMFAYAPRVNDESGQILGQGIVNSAKMNAEAKVKLANDIGSALTSVANAYGKYSQGKTDIQGMDKAMGAMSDIGALPDGFYTQYMNTEEKFRPYIFDLVASPMFNSYNAGQSAAAQAQAWDQYKRNWGSDAGGQPGGGWTVY